MGTGFAASIGESISEIRRAPDSEQHVSRKYSEGCSPLTRPSATLLVEPVAEGSSETRSPTSADSTVRQLPA